MIRMFEEIFQGTWVYHEASDGADVEQDKKHNVEKVEDEAQNCHRSCPLAIRKRKKQHANGSSTYTKRIAQCQATMPL